MPKPLIPLILLCSLTLSVHAQAVAPGMRLSPETAVAAQSLGPVSGTLEAIVPAGSGFLAYLNVSDRLIAVPIAADGHSDLGARLDLGPAASVVIAGGRPLLLANEDNAILAARVNVGGTRTPAVTVAMNASLQSAGCDDRGCLVTFSGDGTGRWALALDAEGRPTGAPNLLPDFYASFENVAAIVADDAGFTLLRNGGTFVSSRLVRVDRSGRVLFDIPLPGAWQQSIRLVPAGDHPVMLAIVTFDGQPFISATSISSTGALSPPQPLVKATSVFSTFTIERRGNGYLIALREAPATLYDINASLTIATPAGSFDVPAGMTLLTTASNGPSTIAAVSNGAIFSMSLAPGSTPSLLSFGSVPQTPQGVVSIGPDFLAAWTEGANLRAGVINASGVVLKTFIAGDRALSSLTSIGTDALAISYDSTSSMLRGAIIRIDGSVEPFDIGRGLYPRATVATDRDWVVFASDTSGQTLALRISRSGMVFPPKTINPGFEPLSAAATDGNRFLLVFQFESIVLTPELEIEQRHPEIVSYVGSVAFSQDSYLFSDGVSLIQFSRDGEVLSKREVRVWPFPKVIARPEGWLLVSAAAVTPVLRGNPPIVVKSAPLPGDWAGVVSTGTPIGILYTRHTASYFRILEFTDTSRRRAVMSR